MSSFYDLLAQDDLQIIETLMADFYASVNEWQQVQPRFWKHLERDEIAHALFYAPGNSAMVACFEHTKRLQEMGMLEPVFMHAYYHTSNKFDVAPILAKCNRAKLMAHGFPLPGDGPFVVYRGVLTATGPASVLYNRRIERGLSWSTRLDVACNYAMRGSGSYNQAVLRATISAENVYYFSNPDGEEEFVCKVDEYENTNMTIPEMQAECRKFDAWYNANRGNKLFGVGPILKLNRPKLGGPRC